MAITATVKYNDLRDTKSGTMRALKVEVPGVTGMITIWLKPDQGEHYKKGDAVTVEQKGEYWNMSKDQPAPGAPMSATPATVTQGQGYGATSPTEIDPEAFRNRARLLAETFCEVSKIIQDSKVYGMSVDEVISKAAISLMISLEKPAARP